MTITKPEASESGAEQADWQALPTSEEGWLARAHEVAATLRTDAVGRDRDQRRPNAEVALLKSSGLTALLGPTTSGGGGAEWPLAYRVVRIIASADGSIGQLLGDHYTWCWLPHLLGTDEQVHRLTAEAAADRRFFGCALNPRDADVQAEDLGEEVRFTGQKSFCTGVAVADYTVVEGVNGDNHYIAAVPTVAPSVEPLDNWDNMGQRLTESGGVTIRNARARWEDVLGYRDKVFQPLAYSTMNIPIGQVLFANLWLGVARGALDAAIDYTQGKRGWGGYEFTVDEPRVQQVIGELGSQLWAAEALADQVAQEALPWHRNRTSITDEERGRHKVRTGALKVVADAAALAVTNRIFEVTGARSTANSFGFDRFWRNVRTHTLHHPVGYQKLEVGAYLLSGVTPVAGRYS